MPFAGIFDADQLAVVCKVLDDHCADHGIQRSSPEHVEVSYLILRLYDNGAQTVAELRAELDNALSDAKKRTPWRISDADKYALGRLNEPVAIPAKKVTSLHVAGPSGYVKCK